MSGWTVLTFEFEDDEQAAIVDEALRIEYDGQRAPTATGYADCTVQLERGISREQAAERWANEYPDANRIVVVQANDTTDSGDGTLFNVDDNGNVEQIDEKHGYEGARGRDVTGYFGDEYGLSGYSTWEA